MKNFYITHAETVPNYGGVMGMYCLTIISFWAWGKTIC
jgi:hypothetical protein